MPGRIIRKWRPPLALVLGGTLAGIIAVPLVGVGWFRVAGGVLGWAETAWMLFWLALAATSVLGWLLWRLVLAPVTRLTTHARALRDGQCSSLPAHFGTPEITALAQAVDAMAATLQDREASLRAYAGHVTHELKSPLTSLIAATELLDDPSLASADRQGLVDTVRASASRMQSLLDALRRLAAAGDPRGHGPCDFAALLATRLALPATIRSTGPVPLPAETLRAVLDQLAQNAARHGASALDLDCDGATLVISDDGPGIPEGDRARIFEPFFTTARDAGGTGMGLAIVRAMLGAAGADIRLAPASTGARFEITF